MLYIHNSNLFGFSIASTLFHCFLFTGVPEVQEAIEVWLEELFAVVHTLGTDLQDDLGNNSYLILLLLIQLTISEISLFF